MYGEILKNLRIEKGLTQHQLAEVLGFKSASAVGMVEREERELNFESLIRVSEYFNVSSDYLMGRVPFKNETEAYHSISVDAIKFFRNDSHSSVSEHKTYTECLAICDAICRDIFDSEIMNYCTDLISRYVNQFSLTNLELFEVSNILMSSIRWTPDYSGIVYFEYFYNVFNFPSTMIYDFKKMEKVTLDLSKSILINYKNGNNAFVRYSSVLDASSKDIKNSKYENHIAESIESNQYTTGRAPKDIELLDDFQDAEHALKFILSQPVLAAYGGYDLKSMSDEEIIEIANDMLFAMRLSLEKLKRKNK